MYFEVLADEILNMVAQRGETVPWDDDDDGAVGWCTLTTQEIVLFF